MPDDPISETLSLGLGQWEDGANPGADALNENFDKIDAAVMVHGDTNPDTYQVGKMFLNDADSVIYRNDGTEEAPTWTAILDVGTLTAAVAAKADQSQVDTIQGDLADAEAAIADLQSADYLKRDGSGAMTGDLDMDSNKIKGLANGVAADEAVNRGQLDAVASSVLAVLGSRISCSVSRSTDETTPAGGGFIHWENEVSDHGDMVDLGTSTTKLFIPQDGTYMFVFDIASNANTAALGLYVNGVNVSLQTFNYQASLYGHSGTDITGEVGPLDLEAGDYVEFRPNHCNGDGSISIGTSFGTGGRRCFAGAYLVASNAVGGGDLRSDGTVGMTADFDNGGFKQANMADGSASDDGATVGQMETADALLQDQIDDITDGAALGGDERFYDAGNQGFSTGDWEPVTGEPPMTFTLATDKFVAVDAHGTALEDFQHRANLQLGIRLQKTGDAAIDVPGTMCFDALGYYVNGTVMAKKKMTLTAGEWTISLIAKKASPSFPYNPLLSKTAALPAYLGYVLTG